MKKFFALLLSVFFLFIISCKQDHSKPAVRVIDKEHYIEPCEFDVPNTKFDITPGMTIFVGDSITSESKKFGTVTYADRLIAEHPGKAVNVAISTTTTSCWVNWIGMYVDAPRQVFIMLGTNDAFLKNLPAQKYRENILRLKQAVSTGVVTFITPPPVFIKTIPNKKKKNHAGKRKLNRKAAYALLKQYVDQILQVDPDAVNLWDGSVTNDCFYKDGIHLNEKGQTLVYEHVKARFLK